MFYFSINPKIQLTKTRLDNDGKVKQKWGHIIFVKASNMIELSNDIDKDIWIDTTLPLAFYYFSIDDDLLEYLGAYFELPKSNKKCKASYVLNEYAYLGQEINFHEVLQVQPLDEDEESIPNIKDSPSLLPKLFILILALWIVKVYCKLG